MGNFHYERCCGSGLFMMIISTIIKGGNRTLFNRYRILLLLLFLISPLVYTSSASDFGHPKYRFQKRKNSDGQWDRKEGIEPIKIAGEKLSLVSALFVVPKIKRIAKSTKKYRIGFFLKNQENRVNLAVRDYSLFDEKYHYWMLPLISKYDSGFSEFSWDATLPMEMGIRIDDLGALTSIGGYGHYVIAPSLLHTSVLPPKIKVEGIRFIFIPNETMNLDYRLYSKKDESRILLTGKSEDWPKGQKSTILWNGRDHRNKPSPEGHYILSLTAKISGSFGGQIFYDYEFYYKPIIIYRP